MQMVHMHRPPPPMGGNRFTSGFRFGHMDKPRFHHHHGGFTPYRPYPRPTLDQEFDGKRLRKSVMRKTVDYNSAIINLLEGRMWQRGSKDCPVLQPDSLFCGELCPPLALTSNPINAVTTKFVKTATNKMRCPIFCLAWTPEGRRLITGASSGEFTLWNGLTFNFETILQAHDSPVRSMVWSHNDVWMITGDHCGYIKYWQSNMNNVKMYQAHKEAIRGLSFSPSDQKFATCSDDGTIRIWDFLRCFEERILRGHGADVRCVDWHPQKGLIVSGSKDNQQPIKLWDPKTGNSLATLHAHKSTVMDVKWNDNGNWLVTASRDHLLKLFDIRNLNQEVQTFRGHKKEASSIAWHPVHEGLFASGGSDGSILFWHVGADKEVGAIESAHESIVWALAWHPLGHILCSGSNDHTSKFWTRNRPGDKMRDKYNLNTLPASMAEREDIDFEELSASIIPGMGPEDKVEHMSIVSEDIPSISGNKETEIPGLDFDSASAIDLKNQKKIPYAKPIPRNFQANWNDTRREDDEENVTRRKKRFSHFIDTRTVEAMLGAVPLSTLQPTGLLVGSKMIPLEDETELANAVPEGGEKIEQVLEERGFKEDYEDMAVDLEVLKQYVPKKEGDDEGSGGLGMLATVISRVLNKGNKESEECEEEDNEEDEYYNEDPYAEEDTEEPYEEYEEGRGAHHANEGSGPQHMGKGPSVTHEEDNQYEHSSGSWPSDRGFQPFSQQEERDSRFDGGFSESGNSRDRGDTGNPRGRGGWSEPPFQAHPPQHHFIPPQDNFSAPFNKRQQFQQQSSDFNKRGEESDFNKQGPSDYNNESDWIEDRDSNNDRGNEWNIGEPPKQQQRFFGPSRMRPRGARMHRGFQRGGWTPRGRGPSMHQGRY